MNGPGRRSITRDGNGVESSSYTLRPSNSTQVATSSTTPQQQPESISSACPQSPQNSTDSSTLKRTRGQTRNITLAKKRRAGEKLHIDISEHVNRVVGENAQQLITESGVIARKYAPLQVTKWSNIDEGDRNGLVNMLLESFQVEDRPHTTRTMVAQLSKQYRDYRHRLHKDYFNHHSTLEEALKHPPPGILEADWKFLCHHFASDEYKAISARNKANRAKQVSSHIAGTKSFSRLRYEKRDSETGKEPDQITFYHLTHFSESKGSWVDDTTQQNFERMVEIRSQSQAEGATPILEEEICSQVLGRKSGYIRGLGAGPKPISSSSRRYSDAEFMDTRQRMEQAEERASEMAVELEAQKVKLESQEEKMESLIARQRETDELIRVLMQQLQNRGHIPPPTS